MRYKLFIGVFIGIFISTASFSLLNKNIPNMKNENQVKEFTSFIKSQTEEANNWNEGNKLPAFVLGNNYTNKYYPSLKEYGGFISIAIIENTTNKEFLMRLLTGCEPALDELFLNRVPQEERWNAKGHYYDYYLHLCIRDVAKYQYQKLYSLKQLGIDAEAKKINNLNLSDCNEETKWFIEGLPKLKTSTTKYIKGVIFTIGTRKETTQTDLVFTNSKNGEETKGSTSESTLKYMSKTLKNDFSSNWDRIASNEFEVNQLINKYTNDITNRFRSQNVVTHYRGPFFENNMSAYIEKTIFENAMKKNQRSPFYYITTINGYVGLVYVDRIYQ